MNEYCIECKIDFEGEDKWCSMKCKEEFFIKYYENSKWTTRLIENSKNDLKERIKATMLITPSPTERGNFIQWLAGEMDKL